MNKILTDAHYYSKRAYRRAVADEISAQYHHKVGERLGLASAALSAIASTSIFVAVTASLGLDAKGTLTIPQEIWAQVLFYIVITLLILPPV